MAKEKLEEDSFEEDILEEDSFGEDDGIEEGNIAEKFAKFANALDAFIEASEENLRGLDALELKYPEIFAKQPQSIVSVPESSQQTSPNMKNT